MISKSKDPRCDNDLESKGVDQELTGLSPTLVLPKQQSASDSESEQTLITEDFNDTVIRIEEIRAKSDESTLFRPPDASSTPNASHTLSSEPIKRTRADIPLIPPRLVTGKSPVITGLYETIPPIIEPRDLPDTRDLDPVDFRSLRINPATLKSCRDQLTTTRDNYAHFISADMTLDTPVPEALIDTQMGSTRTFSIVGKENYYEQ